MESLEYHRKYNRLWRRKHREHANKMTYRNVTRSFMRRYAQPDDIDEVLTLAKARLSKLHRADA